jgi:pimeloyl-ACP methyl ester carboxylesterase
MTGRTLVLLPGVMGDAAVWQPQIDTFSAAWKIVVVPPARHPSIAAYAAHVLLRVTTPCFALAGFSLGGVAALEVYRQAPQRVERLALLSTTARPASIRVRARGGADYPVADGVADYAVQSAAISSRPDGRPVLPTVTCPTLVLTGSMDRTMPPMFGREIAAGISHAVYVELQGIGHMTTIEAPAAVNDALARWLATA